MNIKNKYTQSAWRGILSFDDEKYITLIKYCILLLILWPFVHSIAHVSGGLHLIFVIYVLISGLIIYLMIKYVFGRPTIATQDGRDCLYLIIIFTIIPLWIFAERYVLSYRLNFSELIGIDILVLLSGLLVLYSKKCFRKRRVILNTPTSKIRSAAQGYVEVIGRGEPTARNTLTAPLTQEPCIWYMYNIGKEKIVRKPDGESVTEWEIIEAGTSQDLIMLVDETGWLFIDPAAASITPSVENKWSGDTRRPESQRGLMGSYRYYESYIRPGDSLYVIGQYLTNPGIDPQSHEEDNISNEVNEIVMQWKKESDRLLQEFDANQDGTIGPNEWKKIREEAVLAVLNRRHESQLIPNIPRINMMSQTFNSHQPFIISTVPQHEIVTSLYIKGFLAMVGAISSLYFLLVILSKGFQ